MRRVGKGALIFVGCLVLVFLVVLGTIVVLQVEDRDVIGLYHAQNGREIRFAENGRLTEATLPVLGIARRTPLRYWVRGNRVFAGQETAKSPKGIPVTFRVQADGRLVGWDTIWRKYRVEPNRPPSLVATYTSVPGETIALDTNGAAYYTKPLPRGEEVGSGIWVAGKGGVTITYPGNNKTTYVVEDGNLVSAGKRFVRTADRAIVPATK